MVIMRRIKISQDVLGDGTREILNKIDRDWFSINNILARQKFAIINFTTSVLKVSKI